MIGVIIGQNKIKKETFNLNNLNHLWTHRKNLTASLEINTDLDNDSKEFIVRYQFPYSPSTALVYYLKRNIIGVQAPQTEIYWSFATHGAISGKDGSGDNGTDICAIYIKFVFNLSTVDFLIPVNCVYISVQEHDTHYVPTDFVWKYGDSVVSNPFYRNNTTIRSLYPNVKSVLPGAVPNTIQHASQSEATLTLPGLKQLQNKIHLVEWDDTGEQGSDSGTIYYYALVDRNLQIPVDQLDVTSIVGTIDITTEKLNSYGIYNPYINHENTYEYGASYCGISINRTVTDNDVDSGTDFRPYGVSWNNILLLQGAMKMSAEENAHIHFTSNSEFYTTAKQKSGYNVQGSHYSSGNAMNLPPVCKINNCVGFLLWVDAENLEGFIVRLRVGSNLILPNEVFKVFATQITNDNLYTINYQEDVLATETETALLFGLNYPSDKNMSLRGCVNDANSLARLYKKKHAFRRFEIITDTINVMTRDIFVRKIEKLAEMSRLQKGSKFTISYAGHGARVHESVYGSESDHMDECIVLNKNERLRDDDFRNLLADFDPSSSIFILMDCCHSATMLDLPVSLSLKGGNVSCTLTGAPLFAENSAKCLLISACADDQKARESVVRGEFRGYFTSMFAEYVRDRDSALCMSDLLHVLNANKQSSQTVSVSMSHSSLEYDELLRSSF